MCLKLVPTTLDEYAEEYSTQEQPPLPELARETHIKTSMGVMLSGHLQGTFLKMISHMVQPRYVLEIGTFTGYSAICLAQGLQKGGMLHTIEADEELHDMAAKYFKKAGLEHAITQHTGYATDIIPTLDFLFDLVFIDADKVNYYNYYKQVFDKVRQGGFILADNMLYKGEVLLRKEEQSKNASAIHHFNVMLKQDGRIEEVLLPIRDGLKIIRKK